MASCGDDECMQCALGYPWCRPCGDHHRPPECAIDSEGRSLASCGCPWEVLDLDPMCPHYEGDPYNEQVNAYLEDC